MKPSLVAVLRCPISGDELRLLDASQDETGEIRTGKLVSASGHTYTIEDGVPILLDPAHFAPGQAETVESFGEKWKRASTYRESSRNHYVSWFLERYGFGSMESLTGFLATKKRILEAGSGLGRDAELYARHSDAQVYAIDISSGIHLAFRDLGHIPNLHFVRADLRALPFPPGYFDFVACDQVIHHTPDTFESLKKLVRFLGSGHLAFYVYKVKGPIREFCDDYLRERTTKMSAEECLEFSEAMTQLGKALTEAKVEIDIPVDIPLLGISRGRFDLQRWIYWNFFKCYWNDGMDWSSNLMTNFDWYHPLHAHRHTPEEVQGWLRDCELTTEHFSVVESGISVLARRESGR